jgi:hypothetical protein
MLGVKPITGQNYTNISEASGGIVPDQFSVESVVPVD